MASPRMTRAHFQLIADAIKDQRPVLGRGHTRQEGTVAEIEERVLDKLSERIASRLSATNPDF